MKNNSINEKLKGVIRSYKSKVDLLEFEIQSLGEARPGKFHPGTYQIEAMTVALLVVINDLEAILKEENK